MELLLGALVRKNMLVREPMKHPVAWRVRETLEDLESWGYSFAAYLGTERPLSLEQFCFYTADPMAKEFQDVRLKQQAMLLRFLDPDQAHLPMPKPRLLGHSPNMLGDWEALKLSDAFQDLQAYTDTLSKESLGLVLTLTVREGKQKLRHIFMHNGIFDLGEWFVMNNSCNVFRLGRLALDT